MTTFAHSNAVDARITSFHEHIDLDQDLNPVLTNAHATNKPVFSKAAFSLEYMRMDFGDKLYCMQDIDFAINIFRQNARNSIPIRS